MHCITNLPSWDQVIDVVRVNVVPLGVKNGVNLSYMLPEVFLSGTLEIWLDGVKLDHGIQYNENISLNGFTIIVDPADYKGLAKGPRCDESLTANYLADTSKLKRGCVINI
jgi:hypothetical protein